MPCLEKCTTSPRWPPGSATRIALTARTGSRSIAPRPQVLKRPARIVPWRLRMYPPAPDPGKGTGHYHLRAPCPLIRARCPLIQTPCPLKCFRMATNRNFRLLLLKCLRRNCSTPRRRFSSSSKATKARISCSNPTLISRHCRIRSRRKRFRPRCNPLSRREALPFPIAPPHSKPPNRSRASIRSFAIASSENPKRIVTPSEGTCRARPGVEGSLFVCRNRLGRTRKTSSLKTRATFCLRPRATIRHSRADEFLQERATARSCCKMFSQSVRSPSPFPMP